MTIAHPRRVKIGGNVAHPILPAGAIWAARQAFGYGRSPYANPHAADNKCKKTCGGIFHTLAESLALYCQHLDENSGIVRRAAAELDDARFACWCRLDQECHVDELLRRVDVLRAAA